MVKYRYSVLTFIFGNYEQLREVVQPQDDVEYILVTDDKSLTSKTWKIINDDDLKDMSIIEKCLNVRYNIFKYCSTDICVTIDGSILLKGSLDTVIKDFIDSNADMGLLCHPTISTYYPELLLWVNQRNYPVEYANRFLRFLANMKYDLNYKSHFQNGVSIRKRGKITTDFQNLTLAHLKYIGDDDIERIDQLMSDYVLNRYFNHLKIFLISLNCLESNVMQIYKHRSNEEVHVYRTYDFKTPEYAYCFNKQQECYYVR